MIRNPLLKDTTHVDDPEKYINSAIQAIFSVFFIVGILYFVWHFVMAGYHLIDSQGDPKKLEDAKNSLTYAAIGLVVVFSVFAVLKLIGTILGIPNLENLKITIPSIL